MSSLENIAISASAGSGKTYQLTNRFIYLLHLSEAPERIIALTFTRTAAGEFFHKIIEKLCDASESEAKATQLSEELQIDADRDRYRSLLLCVIRNMHRLNLQTLDSFFFRVVSAFSLELGLSGNLRLLDESSEPRMRNLVRDSIVHRPGELTEELHEFWHAFKQATYGREERSVDVIITQFIEALYALYLENPDSALWGHIDRIWPDGCPWAMDGAIDWLALANQLRANLPEGLNKSQSNDFENAALKIETYAASEDLNTLLKNALSIAPDLFNGRATLKVRKPIELPLPTCQALAHCLRAVVWHHLQRASQNTQGVYRILQTYHENYDTLVRRPGQLAFADLTHLLAQADTDSPLASKDGHERALMDYRLDAKFDHWLFDEFQDTSRPQWQVVANLIDEIVQDSSGQRSFFYVGDTKQCLYLWRNSDDRLFHDIQSHYNRSEPKIQSAPLFMSWRSAPAILEAVNTVFGDHAAISENFSADASKRWARAWKSHLASPATENQSGYACWIEAGKDTGSDRNSRILQILSELNPIERGISVGILVRKNTDANEVADFLREHSDFPIHTGSAVQPAVDNAAGAALLTMLRLATHPGDRHAQGYLQLIDCSTAGSSLIDACPELRRRLHSTSCESAVRWACQQIAAHLSDGDRHHHERLDRLIALARAFDQEEQNDPDSLYQYLKESRSGECHGSDQIIVETIHKSKGLEYDVVLLACEDKTVRTEQRISPLLETDGSARWILEPLKKDLMQADPELQSFLDQTESQQGFGNLCTLYVAMTRAKRALYMISDLDRVSQGSTVHYLRDILGDSSEDHTLFPQSSTATAYPLLWQTGDLNWHQTFKIRSKQPDTDSAQRSETIRFSPAHPRLQLARPSSGSAYDLPAHLLFDLSEQSSAFGTRMHAAFQKIEWLDDAIDLHSLSPDPAVCASIKACFDKPEIRALFQTSDPTTTVWRERAFTYVEGDQYISGIFDRVLLEAHKGHTKATIIDFKTDRIHSNNTLAEASEHHREQLEMYRKALSYITGIASNAISLKLIFTDVAEVVDLS